MAKYAVVGRGYIGTHLIKKLEQLYGEVGFYPKTDTETIFYMGGVTHMDFNNNTDYFQLYLSGEFNALVEYCKYHSVRLVYCSSALVYEDSSPFRNFKIFLENRAQKELANSLGLRIFPVYGHENGKKSKTAIAKFCEAAMKNEPVEVFGDGNQTRDFIFIDDVIDYIIDMEKAQTTGVVDVGNGTPTSFNEIIEIVNQQSESELKVSYVDPPSDYRIEGVVPEKPLPVKTPLNVGIRKVLLESEI